MITINAAVTAMEEIELFGTPALFTPHRVSRQTVHGELYCYEIRVTRNRRHDTPFYLTEQAGEELYGTVLTPIPMGLPRSGNQPIFPGEFITDLGYGRYTPAQFEEKFQGAGPGLRPVPHGGTGRASTEF